MRFARRIIGASRIFAIKQFTRNIGIVNITCIDIFEFQNTAFPAAIA
jgi:hypothetical protein